MVLLEFSMSPMGKSGSLSPYVARILDIIDRSGVAYQLTSMGTILEGEWPEVMDVVTQCFDELRTDCDRIGIHMKVDYRPGTDRRMASKVDAVESVLGRKLAV
jgi:uncharacterized protein (TIGR00106 family)